MEGWVWWVWLGGGSAVDQVRRDKTKVRGKGRSEGRMGEWGGRGLRGEGERERRLAFVKVADGQAQGGILVWPHLLTLSLHLLLQGSHE